MNRLRNMIARALLLTVVFSAFGGATLHAGLLSEAIAAVQAVGERAKLQRVDADCRAITSALKMYKINSGAYPTEKQGLKALVEKPLDPPLPRRWLRLMARVPLDPWEREYRLVVRKKDDKEVRFIVSQGPNLEEAADDLEHPVDKPEVKEK